MLAVQVGDDNWYLAGFTVEVIRLRRPSWEVRHQSKHIYNTSAFLYVDLRKSDLICPSSPRFICMKGTSTQLLHHGQFFESRLKQSGRDKGKVLRLNRLTGLMSFYQGPWAIVA